MYPSLPYPAVSVQCNISSQEPVTYTSHPTNDQQTACSHIHKQSLVDYRFSLLFAISLPFH